MIFWDTSALMALVCDEPQSPKWVRHFREDPHMSIWWGTPLECESAIQRRLRQRSFTPEQAKLVRELLGKLAEHWLEVPPSVQLRDLALRLLRTHPLRAADALQLAAALSLVPGVWRNCDLLVRMRASIKQQKLKIFRWLSEPEGLWDGQG